MPDHRTPRAHAVAGMLMVSIVGPTVDVVISRIWHGWTALENACAYEALLRTEIFPEIFAKEITGFQRIELFRRTLVDEVEFMTVMWFMSMDAVREFAGDDYESAYVPDAARKILARFDARAQHYEVCIQSRRLPA